METGTRVMVIGKVGKNSGTQDGEWHGTLVSQNGGWTTVMPDAAIGTTVKVRNSKVTEIVETIYTDEVDVDGLTLEMAHEEINAVEEVVLTPELVENIERLSNLVDEEVVLAADDANVEVRFCACGCGDIVSKKSSYRQGHDQRHKGILIRSAAAGDIDAADALVAKGWKSHDEVEVLLAKAEGRKPNFTKK